MAGKHSKNFIDIVKDIISACVSSQNYKKSEISLPFKIVTIVLVISLAVSAIFVGRFFVAGNTQNKIFKESKSYFESLGGNKAVEVLSENNPDIKGWININDTEICYAVCQSDNDAYYMNHNQNGKKSRYGAVALSASDNFERKGNDQNIVIFGNNMKDGTMFGSLKKYRNLNFYKQHSEIDIYYGKASEKYVVFSIMLVSSYLDDAGSIYNPSKSYFSDKQEFTTWYAESCARSLIDTKVTAEYGDKFLTLVTSATDFSGARLVVLAKKVTDWDASHTDVNEAVVNAKIKYPKIWYTERGLEYPY